MVLADLPPAVADAVEGHQVDAVEDLPWEGKCIEVPSFVRNMLYIQHQPKYRTRLNYSKTGVVDLVDEVVVMVVEVVAEVAVMVAEDVAVVVVAVTAVEDVAVVVAVMVDAVVEVEV